MTALSIVVPCFNEEACLAELHQRLGAAARMAVGEDHELVLINDGSRDGSWPVMQQLAASDPHVVAINLSRNHGHQLALTAGLDLCRGETILIIDADLQDPPELLPAMLETMREQEADVVYGVRKSRAGETAFKRATAHGFYRLLSRATEVDIPLDAGDFRLMSRRALDALLAMPEQARFIRGMVAWIGFRQVPFAYDRQRTFRGRDQISAEQDDALRARCADGIFIGAAEARQPCRPVAVVRLGPADPLHRLCLARRAQHPGLDVADADCRRAGRDPDVRSGADGRIYRPPVQ